MLLVLLKINYVKQCTLKTISFYTGNLPAVVKTFSKKFEGKCKIISITIVRLLKLAPSRNVPTNFSL